MSILQAFFCSLNNAEEVPFHQPTFLPSLKRCSVFCYIMLTSLRGLLSCLTRHNSPTWPRALSSNVDVYHADVSTSQGTLQTVEGFSAP